MERQWFTLCSFQSAGRSDRSSSALRGSATGGPDLPGLNDSDLAELVHDPEQGASAREELVRRYGPLVRALAYQYQIPAQYHEDLVQAGYVGLLKAINSFDPSIREELKPYARACASGEMKRFFRDKRWLIRVSRTDQELFLHARKAHADLEAELGATPTDDQVADRLNVSTGALRHAYQAHNAFTAVSLDTPVSADDARETGELFGADDAAIDHSADMETVRRHWRELPRLQRRVLLLRFYGNMSQSQVADRLNCSQMQVSRLQTRALAFLRGRLLAE
jgi:RNA polymerase sigma-B factor